MAHVYVYSPSGAVRDRAAFRRGVRRLQALGHDVEVDTAALLSWQRFAGDDATRLAAIGRAAASGADVALMTRGGYGLSRLLPSLPYRQLARAIAKGTRFKVEVTNNAECYTYIFGEETDGSTYTLFPYTPKHSPYCGITGTRVFPKDHSLTADEVGTTDVMAIVVYNQPVNYPAVNEAMTQSPAKGLEAKLASALGNELMPAEALSYQQGPTFGASGPASANAVAFVLKIDKR